MTVFTRKPVHDGYNELGTENTPGEDHWILANGLNIGTTWYCAAGYARDGERWASDGPAGHSTGHRTREDAEQAQTNAYLANPSVVINPTTDETPAQPDPAPLPMSYAQALAEAEQHSVSKCSDPALMASLCDGPLQTLVGAVAPQLVWEGAQKKGLTSKELLHLCHTDPLAVSELMWL
ncbi:hypothetical protein AB0O64_36760 [Streptomyces sp. NPDC088341]|uniref:hypothetical protein n=1 Tax=Streptomyces sp. NPDC088341 TaxID=3154870 RepID=UPI00343E837B